ncbi:MAG: UvrD-helicase domain-containing protein, partial [Chloroflexota bacterium]
MTCGLFRSGKTTTLVARICWLVASGADPLSITAVTFNKRAADELGVRLASALEPFAPGVAPRVRTFHALGREILAEAGAPVKNLTDRAEVLRALNGGRALPPTEMRRLDDGFSRLKLDLGLDMAASERLLGAAEPPADTDLLHRFIAYERWLADRSAL